MWTSSVGWPAHGRDEPPEDARNLGDVHQLVGVREHRFFLGALDPAELPVIQRLVFRMRGRTSGDLRDWAAIDAWTDEIARRLTASPSTR